MRIFMVALAAFFMSAAPLMAQPVAIPPTATLLIPGSSLYRVLGYQVQGTGVACLSFQTSAVTITGTDDTAKCGGAGAFLVKAYSVDRYQFPGPVPATALWGIGAAGSALQLQFVAY